MVSCPESPWRANRDPRPQAPCFPRTTPQRFPLSLALILLFKNNLGTSRTSSGPWRQLFFRKHTALEIGLTLLASFYYSWSNSQNSKVKLTQLNLPFLHGSWNVARQTSLTFSTTIPSSCPKPGLSSPIPRSRTLSPDSTLRALKTVMP